MHKLCFVGMMLFGTLLSAMGNLSEAQNYLTAIAQAYRQYHEKMWGCDVCRFRYNITDETKYGQSQSRVGQIDELIKVIAQANWYEELPKHLTKMEPFYSKPGNSFKASCLRILLSISNNSNVAEGTSYSAKKYTDAEKSLSTKKIEEEDPPESAYCVLCIARLKTVTAIPCGHVLYCNNIECEKNYKTLHVCALCRTDIDQYAVLTSCCYCNRKKEQMFYGRGCGDFMCKDCKEEKNQSCSHCKDPKTIIRVYID
jgi:hypothetical protein